MNPLYPWQFLVVAVLVTAGALAWHVRVRARQGRRLRELAGRLRVHYSARDRFGLGPRVAKYFPVPGVADVRVTDLLYRSDDEGGHRYVFTADYTRGVLGTKRRVRSVVRMTEGRPVGGREGEVTLTVAEGEAGVGGYERLLGE